MLLSLGKALYKLNLLLLLLLLLNKGTDEIINNTGGTKLTNQNSGKPGQGSKAKHNGNTEQTDLLQQSRFLIILTTF